MNPFAVLRIDLVLPLGILMAAAIILGLVQLSELQRRSATERIREALRLAGISQEKAALWMEVDKSDLVKMLQGDRKLDWWRLEMLPESFHQHWHFLGLRDRGLPDIVKCAIKMAPAFADEKESA